MLIRLLNARLGSAGVYAAACALVVMPAQAATVSGVSGQVIVNEGSGFGAAANGMIVKPGDQIVVNVGGTARLVYSPTCSVPIEPGAVVTVSAQPPCAAQAIETGSNPAAAAGASSGFSGTALVIGAVAIGGAVAAVAASGGGSKGSGSGGGGSGGDGGASQ